MKHFTSIFIVFLFLLIFIPPRSVSAHAIGQPPFFKINDKYAGYYNAYNNALITSSFFTLPQDQSPENYLVGQQINFEIDPIVLPQPLDVTNHSLFNWDFGDGQKTAGLVNTHAYGKPGSYILNIYDKYADNPQKLIESALIQIIPDKNYHPPQAVITVNGKTIHDPVLDVVTLSFDKSVSFDAGKSIASSKIVEYYWDFGNGLPGNKPQADYKYNPDVQRVFPILRVKDELGLYSDTYAYIENSNPVISQSDKTSPSPSGNILPAVSNTGASNLSDRILLKINLLSRSFTNRIFEVNLANPIFLALALLLVFAAGGLHALTPGHGKSIMAAFLIGKKESSYADVFLLAAAITLTHTFIIFLLGFIFLVLNRQHTLTDVIPYFEKLGALVVLTLSVNLIHNGWLKFIHSHSAPHHHHEDQIVAVNSSGIKTLLFAGFSGGIIPCVDAFALLLLSVTTGRVLLGIVLVFIFSLGLASTIIFMGLLLILGKHSFGIGKKLGKLADVYMPIISGVLLALISLHLLLK